jgi:transcriptional regulator with XRE-family HTH domain
MPKKFPVLLPRVQHSLEALGGNIRLARLRRDLSAEMVAERAGISRQTLSALEHGSGSVSMAAWIQVLFVLGLEKDLETVAQDDELGRVLQDARLPTRSRARKSRQKDEE